MIIVSSGQTIDVFSGTQTGDIVSSGGTLVFLDGGTAIDTTVMSGGTIEGIDALIIGTNLEGGLQYVDSGIASATIVGSGGYDIVISGGIAYATTVNSSGSMEVDGAVTSGTVVNGGALVLLEQSTTYGTTLNSLAIEEVEASTVSGTTINSGGFEIVQSGSVAVSAAVKSGGYLLLVNGGTATAAAVSRGGHVMSKGVVDYEPGSGITSRSTITGASLNENGFEFVINSGIASNTLLVGNSYQDVYSGGTTIGTVLGTGAEEAMNGGTASATTIESGADLFIGGASIASGTVITDGGYAVVDSSASAIEVTTLTSGGGLFVISGIAIGTTVSGGTVDVITSGSLYATAIDSGGFVELDATQASQVTDFTIVNSGGLLNQDGGATSGTIVSSGGEMSLTGGTTTSLTIDSGGFTAIKSGTATGTVISSGGYLQALGGTTSNTTIAGGTLEIGSGSVATDAISFTAAGTLTIDAATMPSATISGFVAGDVINLQATSGANGTVAVKTAGIATISAGGHQYALNIAGATVGESDLVFMGGSLRKSTTASAQPAARSLLATPAASQTQHTSLADVLAELDVGKSKLQSLSATISPRDAFVVSSGHISGGSQLISVPTSSATILPADLHTSSP